MTLHHGRRTVYVDHQPGQRIALAVHQTVAVGRRIIRQRQRAPHVVSHGQAVAPPSPVDLLAFERQHAHRDRAYLVMSAGNEIARFGIHVDHIALGYPLVAALHALDGAREDPRVATQERLLLSPPKIYSRRFRIHSVISLSRRAPRWAWRVIFRKCLCTPKRQSRRTSFAAA